MDALALEPTVQGAFDMTDKLLRQGSMVERAKRSRDAAVAKAQAQAMPVQGDLFQTVLESVPHAFVRSALFTANRKGPRAGYLTQDKVYSFRNFDISRRGRELRQFDLEVWTKILSLYRREFDEAGNAWPYIRFTGYAMLKALGMSTTVDDYKRLAESLDALKQAEVIISETRAGKRRSITSDTFNLLNRLHRDDKTKEFIVWVDTAAAALFAPGSHSPLALPAHQKLRPNPLAQFLHAHLSSHPGTFQSMKYESLRSLSGRAHQKLSTFRADTGRALDLLERHKLILSWQDIEGSQFAIRQNFTKTQLRALGIGVTDASPAPASPAPIAAAVSLSEGLNATQKRLFEQLAGGIGFMTDEAYSELRAKAVAAAMPDHVLEHFDNLMDESRF